MTSKHYRWQLKWALDLKSLEAKHECGFLVRFTRDGERLRMQPANKTQIIAELTVKNGGHNAPRMVERMVREAAELMSEAAGAAWATD